MMSAVEQVSALRGCDDAVRLVVDTIPTLVWSARSDGAAEFFNQPWLDYTGLSAERAMEWGWKVAIHPEDLPRMLETFQEAIDARRPFELEGRLRRADGAFRWFLVRGNPLVDESGQIVKWYGTNIDIEDRKCAEEALRASEHHLRRVVDGIPGFVFTATADGEIEFVNQQILDYTGRTLEELKRWATTDLVHADDLPEVLGELRRSIETGQSQHVEHRVRGADGRYRWFDVRRLPQRDPHGRVLRWYLVLFDIDDRKRAEEALRLSERKMALLVDSIPGFVAIMSADGQLEQVNRPVLDYFGRTLEELKRWGTSDMVHPDDLPGTVEAWRHSVRTGELYDTELRHRRADGAYRWFQSRGVPVRDADGRIVRWHLLLTDIDDRKRAEEALRTAERDLRLIFETIPGFVWTMTATGDVELVSQQMLEYFATTLDDLKDWSAFVHPDDRARVVAYWRQTIETGQPYDVEHRLRRADGTYRWFHGRGRPLRDAEGRVVRWHNLLTDVDDRKQAEDKLRRSEWLLLEAQRLGHSGWFSLDVASRSVLCSPEGLRLFDAKPGDDCGRMDFFVDRIHPEDRQRALDLFERCVVEKRDYEVDFRLRLPDGTIRYHHAVAYPVLNAAGDVVEYVGSGIDTTEQMQARIALEQALDEIKRLKDRLHDENLALREQIDQAFMFEEIVGSSAVLKRVLSSIVNVAPTDSTVLITGETGTGKELIARAIHKRSPRSGHAFISVNCASIPASLIASELFGHEKGAFTGALQQRRGRFELAHSGTIFLDEVGELPADTQIALLRVLQERQFERVGGSRVVSTDVRVIAATNRDLAAAIASGTFRADLFYRLNVFPIHIPPLRDRKEDIPMLVEYFVKRYAEKARKRITKINKKTVTLLRSYEWPGNIRELQNIIERSVILCNSDTLWVDPAWLAGHKPSDPTSSPGTLMESLKRHEKDVIEAALARSKGRVAGPHGAAAALGMKRSTLDFRIKQLKIKKHKFVE